MLEIVTDDYELKTNIFRLYRNIYIFHLDNIFDDENRIYDLVRPLMQSKPQDSPKKPEGPPTEKQHSVKFEESKEEAKRGGKGGSGKGRGQAIEKSATEFPDEYNTIIEIIKDQLVQFISDAKKIGALQTPEEKKVFSAFGVTMLMSTINYIAKEEVQKILMTTRRAVVMKQMQSPGPGPGLARDTGTSESTKLLFFVLDQLKDEKVIELFQKVFTLNPNTNPSEEKGIIHVHLYEDIERDALKENLKDQIKEFSDIVNRCEYYSSGEDKESYKIYNLGSSTDMVKRFSNKLEERQKSVRLPLDILKGLFLALKKEEFQYRSFGMIIGTFYECYKLRKLSTFSSMKNNYEDENIDNIYMRILKDSKTNKDKLSANLGQFLITELGGGVSKPKIVRKHTRSASNLESLGSPKKRESILEVEGALNNKDEEQGAKFVTGKRNNKYVLLEIFSNVIFHATEVFQEIVYQMLKNPSNEKEFYGLHIDVPEDKIEEEMLDLDMSMLDSIWHELLVNFSFSYNRTRQDKLWKEYYQRTILLIKFHQYLCEENNEEFKEIFRVCHVETLFQNIEAKSNTRYEHINTLMTRFWYRCDWSKKNFILIKRGFMFPVVGAFYDFLTESMTGPYLPNQKFLIETALFIPICSFLDTFEPQVQSNILAKGKQLESDNKFNNVYNIDVNFMNKLKLSLCDFLLTCCEGHDVKVLENQLKKINYTEILETVVKLIKALTFKYYSEEKKRKNKTITYQEYKKMKKVYKSSGFNEEQTMFLDMALKLFVYLKLMAEYSHTLKHMLENKVDLVVNMIKKKKMLQIEETNVEKANIKETNFLCFKRKKKRVDDFDDKDFEDGLCLKFLGSFAKKLEIIPEEENLEAVGKEFLFFESNPKFSFLSEETKAQFLEDVDRSSHEAKLHGLITSCTYFEEEINITEKIKQKHPKMSSWFTSYKEYEIVLFLFCVLINVFIVFDDPKIRSYSLIKILGIIMCVSTGLCFIVWMCIRYQIEKKLNILRYCERKGCRISGITNFSMFTIIWETIFNENLVRVLLLHLICSFLGVTSSHGFYAIEIISIINLFATFKYLAKSISSHWRQLLFTFFMVIIFLYIYSVFSNLYFYHTEDGDDQFCVDIIHCFFALLNTGFTNGSGVAGMLQSREMDRDGASYFGYVFFDLMFFLTVNCISLNLVFGIIVDTFGELREQNDKYGGLLNFINFGY